MLKKCNYKKRGAKVLLFTLDQIARKNAYTACRGFMYEPKVPKKLENVMKTRKNY